MPTQMLVLTTMARAVSVNPGRLPVSVVLSPRLGGGSILGEFPDWLEWTSRLQRDGLALTFRCGDRTIALPVQTSILRPRLWGGIFKRDTLVRPFVFDDYADRAVVSFPVRTALSALKWIYQQAAFELALPERAAFRTVRLRHADTHRAKLTSYLRGLAIFWDERSARDRRANHRREIKQTRLAKRRPFREDATRIGRDGLILPARIPTSGSDEAELFNRAAAEPFGFFHHMPQPPLEDDPPRLPPLPEPDWDQLFDFHQALSALQNYRELQRRLGLVFELELPEDFVPIAPPNQTSTLAVVDVAPGWDWDVVPEIRGLKTAVVHSEKEPGERLFFTAPAGVLSGTNAIEVFGLLNLDPVLFGVAQVDVDGAMHKAVMLAETLHRPGPQPPSPPRADVFDGSSTLPWLRSGGFSLFADGRALSLMARFDGARTLNAAIESGQQTQPLTAEDLVRGYRIDVWDSRSREWHSLHLRNATYVLGEEAHDSDGEEGVVKLVAPRASPEAGAPEDRDDLYLHEAIARWSGWSLSVPLLGKHLSRFGDPDKAIGADGDPAFIDNDPRTPFKMTTTYTVVPGSLPSLRFGTRYRMRARVVDLAGHSSHSNDRTAARLSDSMSLPADAEGIAYLRYDPVAAPVLVLRDMRAVTLPGSELERIVIRSFNSSVSLDTAPASRIANDRHIAPPRTSVDMGERLGMFDDVNGKLISTDEMYELIARRDKAEFRTSPEVRVAGRDNVRLPLEPDERLDDVPYLPDPLARGAAFRDLPGTPERSIGAVAPGTGGALPVPYRTLDDPNPRAGSATLVDFGGGTDWKQRRPFRISLEDGAGPPAWDPVARVLAVYLPKGTTRVVPMSSFMTADDLKLMGVWEWLREYIEFRTANQPLQQTVTVGADVDAIAHVLQRAVEGGHWMLTPPRLVTLVHAVQQPIGVPRFGPLAVQRRTDRASALQTEPEVGVTAPSELAAITAWRSPGSVEAFLLGALHLHVPSTAKVDLVASWEDPIDDPASSAPGIVARSAAVDEIPVPETPYPQTIALPAPAARLVGHCIPELDVIAFVKAGDALGSMAEGAVAAQTAAPRHHLNDTRHHVIRYTAVATSRYRDYFDADLDFTRRCEAVAVDVPASARPDAPRVVYAIPTFGWQRQTATSLKRSVRLGGGVRVYLERPWFSSGAGELLGVVLWNPRNGPLDREAWKPFITQWGVDPIWQSAPLFMTPAPGNFAGFETWFPELTLEEPAPGGARGVVDVVAYRVQYDRNRQLWYSDIVLNTWTPSYMPFLRLALARFQPHALRDAMLSRVVLTDFVQLTPDRSALLTADPSHPRRLRVAISGPAARGPKPRAPEPTAPVISTPTAITVRVEARDEPIESDLAWAAAPPGTATITAETSGGAKAAPDLTLWAGTVLFAKAPAPHRFRLLIEEHEYVSADYTVSAGEGLPPRQPGRLIYAETIELDAALVSAPEAPTDGGGTEAAPQPPAVPPDAPYGPFAGPRTPAASDMAALPALERMEDPAEVDGHVKLLQALLNAAGARPPTLQPLAVDGNFGPNTEAALNALQASHLLPVTGVADGMTWYALMIAAPFARLEPGPGEPPMEGPPIALVQELLNLAGAFPPIAVNGVFDEDTHDALTSFQQERSLPATGITDVDTWLALGRVIGETAATGAMALTFGYDVLEDPPLTFVSKTDTEATSPLTLPIEGSAVGTSGYLVELQDANGLTLYRQLLDDPFGLTVEGPHDLDPGPFARSARALESGTITVVLPKLARSARVVFICSPLDPARMQEPASEVASFDIALLG